MKKVKAVFCVLLVFFLGATCGGLVAHMVYKSRMDRYFSGDWKVRQELLIQRLSRKLDLDGGQREKLRSIVEQTHAELKNIRKQYRPQMEAVFEKSRAEVRTILRPEQREKFEQFIARRKAGKGKDE